MTTKFLFSDNAQTTLASGISAGATAIALAPGTGALFPNPSAGQQFAITFNDVGTGLLYEIAYCTARTGDTLTVVRGQEGTTAHAWNAADLAGNFWTSGQAAAMFQNASTDPLQLSGTLSGTVSVQVQANAGTYNWNLPITAGSSGTPVVSGGGGSSPMTFGAVTGSGNFVLSAGPTLTGTLTAATGVFSGRIKGAGVYTDFFTNGAANTGTYYTAISAATIAANGDGMYLISVGNATNTAGAVYVMNYNDGTTTLANLQAGTSSFAQLSGGNLQAMQNQIATGTVYVGWLFIPMR